jgi:adenylate kinase
VALTGTPGTGKTTIADRVGTDPDVDLEVVDLGALVEREGLTTGYDEDRDSVVVDVEAVRTVLADRTGILVESHLAHRLDVDCVVVLRCHPEELVDRLEDRGYDDAKLEENAESEALDVVLTEAVERHGLDAVYEVDTTGRDPDVVAGDVVAAMTGDRDPSAGTVSFVEYLTGP